MSGGHGDGYPVRAVGSDSTNAADGRRLVIGACSALCQTPLNAVAYHANRVADGQAHRAHGWMNVGWVLQGPDQQSRMDETMKAEMSRSPYRRNGGPPRLRRSVFAYVDILGYRDLIEASRPPGDQQGLLERLHGALSSGRKWLDDGDAPEPPGPAVGMDRSALKAFTDNIAIGWPIAGARRDGEGELGAAFGDLAWFQLTMVNEGFFVRGAVSVGDVYVDDIAVFGEALMEAYRGESELARDPRIILTESACRHVRAHVGYYWPRHEAPQNRVLIRDTDGQWFLNYLDAILDPGIHPFFDELERHKASVQSRLEEYRRKPGIFSKYAWAAGYHNFFCDLHGFRDYRIDIEVFAADRGYIADDL